MLWIQNVLSQNWHDDGSVTLKLGRINDDEILFEEDILTTAQDIGIRVWSLVGNTLYSFDPWKLFESSEGCVYVIQLGHRAQTTRVSLNPLPDQFSTVGQEDRVVGNFAMNRLYLAVQDKQTKNYGIIWTNYETSKWKLSKFCTESVITCIDFMIDGQLLLIQTVDNETELISDVHQIQMTLYRIPLKKPEKLTHLAWFSLIRSKSKIPDVDPCEEASK